MPTSIFNATRLLWISMVIQLIGFIVFPQYSMGPIGILIVMSLSVVMMSGIYYAKRWIRPLWILMLVVSWLSTIPMLLMVFSTGFAFFGFNVMINMMNTYAVTLLFGKQGKRWFTGKSAALTACHAERSSI